MLERENGADVDGGQKHRPRQGHRGRTNCFGARASQPRLSGCDVSTTTRGAQLSVTLEKVSAFRFTL